MTIQELKAKMREAEEQCERVLDSLQDNDVAIKSVDVDVIEATTKDSVHPRYIFKVRIKTEIV